MKKLPSAQKIKKDVSKKIDVSTWTFFYNSQGGLEFYETNPFLSYIFNSNFKDYDEDINQIADTLIWQNSKSQK